MGTLAAVEAGADTESISVSTSMTDLAGFKATLASATGVDCASTSVLDVDCTDGSREPLVFAEDVFAVAGIDLRAIRVPAAAVALASEGIFMSTNR